MPLPLNSDSFFQEAFAYVNNCPERPVVQTRDELMRYRGRDFAKAEHYRIEIDSDEFVAKSEQRLLQTDSEREDDRVAILFATSHYGAASPGSGGTSSTTKVENQHR